MRYSAPGLTRLERLEKSAINFMHTTGADLRIRNLSSIGDPRKRAKEALRHKVTMGLRSFEQEVSKVLSTSPKRDALLNKFNKVEIEQENQTTANILELKIENLQEIIELVKSDINTYFPNRQSSNVVYNQRTGELYQGSSQTLKVRPIAQELVAYLWGKKEVQYKRDFPKKLARKSKKSTLVQLGLIPDKDYKIKNIIDYFNRQCKNKNIKAKINRDKDFVWLTIIDDIPASK